MKHRSTLTAGSIISALIGVLIGIFIKNLPESMSFSELVGAIFVIVGVLSILSGIPGLVLGLSASSTLVGKVNLVLSLINLIFGFVLIFYHNEIVLLIVAAYLVIIPSLQIILVKGSKMKKAAAKALVPRIVLGVLVILFFNILSGAAEKVFEIALVCIGWVIIGISLLSLLTFLFLLYIKPLFAGKKNASDGTIYLDGDDFKETKK
ncbi:MAG: hypothetical protein IJZ03_02065 [Clostridia bacterium]|nr:hypothetical protein [Clostridia bacterium]